ncbi:MAG: ATP-dependent Clp protease ATP-binding subunit [Christensenellaceae bacterium]|jgi:ATP-dependent Clp protease ATP-binding subunit ClpC|nr:ATP-dependent Clp protease ATP-binding subunit [Christensenellaceae bacterium]
MEVKFTESAAKTFKAACEIASKTGKGQVGSEHILYGITAVQSLACRMLKEDGVTKEKLLAWFSANGGVGQARMGFGPELSPVSKNILLVASNIAGNVGHPFVCAEHLLLSILYNVDTYAVILLSDYFNVDIDSMRRNLQEELQGANIEEFSNSYGRPETAASEKTLPENLLEMGYDITQKARAGKIDPIIGRDKETERIIEILCRKTKNNPILIGEAGVGKSAVVDGLALAVAKGRVPQVLRDKIIYSLDIGGLMAGTKYRGEMEKRLKDAIETIIENKNIIVFIDEIHTLAQAGSEKGDINPADMLKPYLARGELQTIGATTTDEYRKFIEKDKALERRFQPIMVNPPSVDETILILRGLKDSYEAFHKVKITDEAIIAAAKLSDRYIMDRNLPDKAIDLIDEASSRARVSGTIMPDSINNKLNKFNDMHKKYQEASIQHNYEITERLNREMMVLVKEIEEEKKRYNLEQPKAEPAIGENEIAEVVAKWTGVPVSKITESEKERLMKLEEILHKRVIGQDEAVTAVSKAIRRSRVGLGESKRPIGSFLFLGQTGVGKTELCKALAEAMFDNENNIIRLDMSEYMESHSVAKLIGAPPGYVGFDEGGQLTEQVRRKPYSVVLFDEIEKAHLEVFNILLQVLDDGRLTDSQGRTVNFKNTVIILTSNCGISELNTISNTLGFGSEVEIPSYDYEKAREVIMSAVKRKFKPEFLNRIDVITVFQPLNGEQLAHIATIMINNLNKRLESSGIILRLTENALKYLVEKGTSYEYGARPLKRLIQQEIEDKIADGLLSGTLSNTMIYVDATDGKLSFSSATA